jgi:hypothetical protein
MPLPKGFIEVDGKRIAVHHVASYFQSEGGAMVEFVGAGFLFLAGFTSEDVDRIVVQAVGFQEEAPTVKPEPKAYEGPQTFTLLDGSHIKVNRADVEGIGTDINDGRHVGTILTKDGRMHYVEECYWEVYERLGWGA